MKDNKIAIEIKGLNKKYNDKVIHDNLNLKIYKGEFVAIIGKNGCGKTTLFNQLTGLVEPDDGEINVNYSINMLHQKFDVHLPLTSKEYIITNLKMFDKVWNDEIDEMINKFSMESIMNVNINKLSGGESQKLNLLTSLINDPEILLLDEFTSGLDVQTLIEIINFVKEKFLRENKTIVLISHQPEEIRKISNRICLMQDGQIINEWNTDEILSKYDDDLTTFIYDQIKVNNV